MGSTQTSCTVVEPDSNGRRPLTISTPFSAFYRLREGFSDYLFFYCCGMETMGMGMAVVIILMQIDSLFLYLSFHPLD